MISVAGGEGLSTPLFAGLGGAPLADGPVAGVTPIAKDLQHGRALPPALCP